MQSRVVDPGILCFDIGGTQFRSAVSCGGELLFLEKQPTPYSDWASVRALILDQIRKQSGRAVGISIALAGPVRAGVLECSVPMGLEQSVDVKSDLQQYTELEISVMNDLYAATAAENAVGVGVGTQNFCLISLSTGIGVGAVCDGKQISANIEIGHSVLERDQNLARDCHGHRGCWVAQASGLALKQIGLSDMEESIALQAQKSASRLRSYNAHGIGNVVNAYSPDIIVITGSLGANQFDVVIPYAAEIRQYCLTSKIPKVVLSELGDNAGLIGAGIVFGAEN